MKPVAQFHCNWLMLRSEVCVFYSEEVWTPSLVPGLSNREGTSNLSLDRGAVDLRSASVTRLLEWLFSLGLITQLDPGFVTRLPE